MNQCPECGKSLYERAKRCSCGWLKVEQHEPTIIDHRCQYAIANRRCPLPGTSSPNTRAGGPWYCSEHCRTLNDPKLAEAVLIDAEKNYHKILEDLRDWRDKLFKN